MLVLPFVSGVMALDPFTNRRNGKKTKIQPNESYQIIVGCEERSDTPWGYSNSLCEG
jgi:hypothetical protein